MRRQIHSGLRLRAFYAGHVLGAAMFEAAAGGRSVLCTGDFNTASDRHLGAARVERLLTPFPAHFREGCCALVRGALTRIQLQVQRDVYRVFDRNHSLEHFFPRPSPRPPD